MPRRPEPPPPDHELDLHGLRPEQALRRLGQELHAARIAGVGVLRVITGRGWGNLKQEPILRGKVEAWLGGEEAQRLGVRSFEVVAKGGALDVTLG